MRNPIVWVLGLLALGIVLFLLRGQFKPETRERRRRSRSHRPVISRKQGPSIKLAVDVEKPKRDRKR